MWLSRSYDPWNSELEMNLYSIHPFLILQCVVFVCLCDILLLISTFLKVNYFSYKCSIYDIYTYILTA